MAYKPGKGLDRGATARLLERKHARGDDGTRETLRLPVVDTSLQTDRLLGIGAKKVARCSKCTRPLDEEALAAERPACSRCTGGQVPSANKALSRRIFSSGYTQEPVPERCRGSAAPLRGVRFLPADADEGVEVSVGGREAACDSEDAWLGVRARPAVLRGAYCIEFELVNDCLLRVGWGAPNSRRALGTDDRSFGYGGTGMKSHGNRFEAYGKVHEGLAGAVLTCLLDRRDARKQTISYMLNGEELGVAFRPPLWMADVPLLPAVCGREDWHVQMRGEDFRYSVPAGYKPLAELLPQDGVKDETEGLETARQLFAPAPQEGRRELEQFDVPDGNLLELKSSGDETLDLEQLVAWVVEQCEVPKAAFHIEFADSQHTAIVAFTDHRLTRSVLNAPPPMTEAHGRDGFSDLAEDLLQARRPEDRGNTTDRVARRFIAGALADDATVTKDQLRKIRKAESTKSSLVEGRPAKKRPERSWRSRSRRDKQGDAGRLRPAWRRTRGGVKDGEEEQEAAAASSATGRGEGEGLSERQRRPQDAGSQLFSGALRGIGTPATDRRGRGPRNAFD